MLRITLKFSLTDLMAINCYEQLKACLLLYFYQYEIIFYIRLDFYIFDF